MEFVGATLEGADLAGSSASDRQDQGKWHWESRPQRRSRLCWHFDFRRQAKWNLWGPRWKARIWRVLPLQIGKTRGSGIGSPGRSAVRGCVGTLISGGRRNGICGGHAGRRGFGGFFRYRSERPGEVALGVPAAAPFAAVLAL